MLKDTSITLYHPTDEHLKIRIDKLHSKQNGTTYTCFIEWDDNHAFWYAELNSPRAIAFIEIILNSWNIKEAKDARKMLAIYLCSTVSVSNFINHKPARYVQHQN